MSSPPLATPYVCASHSVLSSLSGEPHVWDVLDQRLEERLVGDGRSENPLRSVLLLLGSRCKDRLLSCDGRKDKMKKHGCSK